jgi:phosphatidate cytidylyltransferase
MAVCRTSELGSLRSQAWAGVGRIGRRRQESREYDWQDASELGIMAKVFALAAATDLRRPKPDRMKLRILTALVLIPPVLCVLYGAPLWLFLLVLLAVVGRGLYEYFGIARRIGARSLPVIAYAAGGALCAGQCVDLRGMSALVPVLLASALLATMFVALLRTRDLKEYMGTISSTLLGILYVGFALSCLVPLGFDSRIAATTVWAFTGKVAPADPFASSPSGRDLLVFLFLIIWAGDALAYVIGRALGRTPLLPRVSPNKTVEGSLGGLLGSLLIGWAFAQWRWHGVDWWRVTIVAGFIAAAGQAGDLAESALKRGSNIKDSGALLPGHGGLLDRMDSLLFAIPALWSVLALSARV